MSNNNFDQTVKALFQGMDTVMSTKTVVGEPQVIGDTIILPLVDVSFGMGAGAFGKEKSSSGAGGIGAKMKPTAILVIRGGETRLVNIGSQDNLDLVAKAIDMVPSTVNKISSIISNRGNDDSVVIDQAIKEADISEEPVREEL